MQFGINLKYLEKTISLESAAKILAEAGIETVDYASDPTSDDWEKKAFSDLALLQNAGIAVHQTHAPMNRYGAHGERHMEYTFSENIPCGSCFFVGYVI